jgi:hypothetical protein
VRRCLIALAAAAAWHPAAVSVLFALLRRRPALAVHASAAMVQLVVDQAPMTSPLLSTRRCPDTAPSCCGPPPRWPAACMTPWPPPLTQLSGPTAWTPSGVRLSALGRRRDALIASTHTVEVYHRLAADSAAFEPDLARALTNFGIRLSALGRWQDAVLAATDAVGVYRRLGALGVRRRLVLSGMQFHEDAGVGCEPWSGCVDQLADVVEPVVAAEERLGRLVVPGLPRE